MVPTVCDVVVDSVKYVNVVLRLLFSLALQVVPIVVPESQAGCVSVLCIVPVVPLLVPGSRSMSVFSLDTDSSILRHSSAN